MWLNQADSRPTVRKECAATTGTEAQSSASCGPSKLIRTVLSTVVKESLGHFLVSSVQSTRWGSGSFPLAGAWRHNSPPSFQIESQLPEIRAQWVAKVNESITLNQKAKNNESKTSVPGNSGAARRRWIVARRIGLAHACVPQIEHGRRLSNARWPTQARPDARSSRSVSAVYGLHSGTTGPVREKGARPRRMRNNNLTRRSPITEL